MLERYEPLVMSLSKRFTVIGKDLDDLVSVSNEALIRAVRAEKGTDEVFATLARRCITNALIGVMRASCRQLSTVRYRGGGINGDGTTKLGFEDMAPDPASEAPFEAVLISSTIEDIKQALDTDQERYVFERMLERGGIAASPAEQAERWADIALEMNLTRTTVWRIVTSIREKALEFLPCPN